MMCQVHLAHINVKMGSLLFRHQVPFASDMIVENIFFKILIGTLTGFCSPVFV